jgi:hypothetical protein
MQQYLQEKMFSFLKVEKISQQLKNTKKESNVHVKVCV